MNLFRALTCAFLLSSLTGCANPKPIVVTEYRTVKVPETLLRGCPPVPRTGDTYGDVLEVAERRATALENCDDRFTELREFLRTGEVSGPVFQ